MRPDRDRQNSQVQEALVFLRKHKKFLLLGHQSPDGDCIGSMLALCAFLRQIGKKAFCVFDDPLPQKYSFLNPAGCTISKESLHWDDVDAVVSLDCGSPARLAGKSFNDISQAHLPLLCIDHHQETPPFGHSNFIDPSASATGELVYLLLDAANAEIQPEMADALFAAIAADTGSFSFSNTTVTIMEIAAHLIKCGADPVAVNENLFWTKSINELQLIALVVNRVVFLADGIIATSFVTLDDFSLHATRPTEDNDSLINTLRYLQGVRVAALFKQIEVDQVKVSLRADRQYDVSEIARGFGGGGHRQAAGFTAQGTITEAIDLVVTSLLMMVERHAL
jgi:phosphoesterase RecJ-like protein